MIVVKSIKEKPKECRGCRLLDESTYDCLINSESPAYTTCEEQYEHCPIEEAPDINVGNMDTTTHDPIPAKTGKNDGVGTSGDCISRTQEIDALRNYLVGKRCPDDGTLTCRLIENEVINKLPSIQPERKKGRWIESNPQNSKLCRLMTCSECGKAYIVNINIPYEDWTEAHKFCVECGADMRGEAE